VGILEQLIGLEAATRAATERGVIITQADLDREHERALRDMSDSLSAITADRSDREAAERLLDEVLAERGMSRDEFDIITRRNAYLRKLVESEQNITEAQLRGEYDRVYGAQVRVRHVQLATLGEAARVKERLAAGEAFADLATRYSANTTTAQRGGLLDPFSMEDERVPSALRQAAFALEPGGVSSAVRVGDWYHVLLLEERLPAQAVDFTTVRDELEDSLRDRLAQPAMFALFEKLFGEATIEIYDAGLARAFRRKHPDRTQ
jgi:foldase protein PrsA